MPPNIQNTNTNCKDCSRPVRFCSCLTTSQQIQRLQQQQELEHLREETRRLQQENRRLEIESRQIDAQRQAILNEFRTKMFNNLQEFKKARAQQSETIRGDIQRSVDQRVKLEDNCATLSLMKNELISNHAQLLLLLPSTELQKPEIGNVVSRIDEQLEKHKQSIQTLEKQEEEFKELDAKLEERFQSTVTKWNSKLNELL